MKVFFPFGPLLLFPDELMLLLFPPDIEEEEVAERFEYLEGELGIDKFPSFSSGLAKEGFETGAFESCPFESFLPAVVSSPFDLFFFDLIPITLLDESLAFLL